MDEDAFRNEAQQRLIKLAETCRAIITRSIELSDNRRAVPADSTALSKYITQLRKPQVPALSILNRFFAVFNEHRDKIVNFYDIDEYLKNEKSVVCWLSLVFNVKPIQVAFAEGRPQLGYIDLTKIYERAAGIKTLAIKSLESNPDDVLVEHKYEDVTFLYKLYRVFELVLEMHNHPDKDVVVRIIERIREASLEDETTTTTTTETPSIQLPNGLGDLNSLFSNLSTGNLSGLKTIVGQLGLNESTFNTVANTVQQSIEAIGRGEKIGPIIDSTISDLQSDPACQGYMETVKNLKDQLTKETTPAPEASNAVTEMIANDSTH